jgi:arginine exporter protein ArgO
MEAYAFTSVIAALVAGLFAGYGIAMPVGAVATYLVALTARTTLRIGAFAALGVATADGLYALIAALAGSAVTPVIQPIMPPLRWASALVLIALAVRSAARAIRQYRKTQATTQAGETPISPVRAYVALLGLTMMNPITVIYFAALVLGNQSTAAPDHPQQAVFVLAAFAASASWQLLLAGGGALLGHALTGSRGRLITTVTSSTVICALALHLLTTAP